LWAGTQAGPARFDGFGFAAMPLPLDGPVGVYAMLQDPEERLWLGTDHGLFCWDNGSWHRLDEFHGLPSQEVWALCVDRSGFLWAGSDRGAVYADLRHANPGELAFQNLGNHEVARTTIYSIDEDREGSLWFGTCIGLFQLCEPALRNYDLTVHGAGPMVLAVARDAEDHLWFGTDQGVLRSDGNSFRSVAVLADLPDQFIRALLASATGGLWIGTRRGVGFLDRDQLTWFNRSDGLADEHVLCLDEDRDGAILIGTTRGGLMVHHQGRFRTYDQSLGLAANRVYALAGDRNQTLWIGTESGLSRLRDDKLTTLDLSLPGKEVSALHLDQAGRLWIGTNRGLARLENSELNILTTPSPGQEPACRFIGEDESGAIWVGAARGLWRFEENSAQRFDGAPWTPREMNFGAWALGADGQLWMGHFNGALQLNPARVNRALPSPPIAIKALTVYEQEIPLTGATPTLTYDQNHPQFRFKGLSYRNPDQLHHEYRLVGYDRNWSSTPEETASYADLPPGDYRFQVRARDYNGRVSLQPAQIDFRIKPPYWRTWWFRGLLGLVAAFLILLPIQHLRLRNRALAGEAAYLSAQVEQEKAAKLGQEAELKILHAQMNPHFMQNAFASTLYFVKSSPEKAEQMLRKLSTLFRRSMAAKSHVWTTVTEEITICEDYLDIQKLRFGDRLQFRIDCSEALRDRRVPSFILQPLIENAVIHGLREMEHLLEIAVVFAAAHGGGLTITVANTGQPLDAPLAEMIREGHALDNINKRLALLDCPPLDYHFEAGRHQFRIEVKG
jgi:streptogramin lyase